MKKREFDLVIYGASGFTGRQVVKNFKEFAPASLKWAIAGRNREKLELVLKNEGLSVEQVPIIVADSQDDDDLQLLAARTHVVVSTAGPYTTHAPFFIRACVEQGTHWCDITGETAFVRQMIDLYHEEAREKGVKIVPFCGFDSVPSDLGTLWAVHEVMKKTGHKTSSVMAIFKAKGGFNGGTLASARLIAERKDFHPMANVFLLDPKANPHSTAEIKANADIRAPRYIPQTRKWAAPFFMAVINTRVVRRSVALFRENTEAELLGYSTQFTYNEMMQVPEPLLLPFFSWTTTLGLGTFDSILKTQWGQSLIKKIGPNPGEGPSEKIMDRGYSKTTYILKDETGETHLYEMRDKGDPGNRVTVKILCECARLLVESPTLVPQHGGVLTPSTAFGLKLVDRLRARGTEFRSLN